MISLAENYLEVSSVTSSAGLTNTNIWQQIDPTKSRSKRHIYWTLLRIYCKLYPRLRIAGLTFVQYGSMSNSFSCCF